MCKNIIVIVLICVCFGAFGQSEDAGWKEENKIYNKVYDATLRGAKVQNPTLHQMVHQNPTILALVFTRCTGVCNPFLLQLKDQLKLRTNDKYTVLVISFDPRDTKADMNLYAKRFGLENDKKWIFAITNSIDSLNESIGFHPIWDKTRQQYDHDALLVGINTEGFITKKLVGLRSEHELSQLIGSMNNVFTPTYQLPNKNRLFSCFNYNSVTGKNTLGLGLLFIALPALITLLILVSVNYFVRSKRV